MKTKIFFLFIIILVGIYSCRNDKADELYPNETIHVSPSNPTYTIDYRDTLVGAYTGTEMTYVSSYIYDSITQNYSWQSTYDTTVCHLTVIKDNLIADQIIINGVGFDNPIHETFLQNDSNLYRVEGILRNDFGYFSPRRNPKSIYLFLDNSDLSGAAQKTYSATKQ